MEPFCDPDFLKKVYYSSLKKGWSVNSSMYFSRKTIHFLAGSLTAMLLPFYRS
jgi:hypothetical protein